MKFSGLKNKNLKTTIIFTSGMILHALKYAFGVDFRKISEGRYIV